MPPVSNRRQMHKYGQTSDWALNCWITKQQKPFCSTLMQRKWLAVTDVQVAVLSKNYYRRNYYLTAVHTCFLNKKTYHIALMCSQLARPVSEAFCSRVRPCTASSWHTKTDVEVEYGLMSHQTHYRSYRGRVFTGQETQSTGSKHWRKRGPKD